MHLLALNETALFPNVRSRLAAAALLAVMIAWSGCSSAQRSGPPAGGEGGDEATGGSTGGKTGGTGGSTGGSGGGGKGGGGSGGAMDASVSPDVGGPSPDLAAGGTGGTPGDAGGGTPGDAPPAGTRPEAGQPCANGTGYAFTTRMFPSQNGKFTAWFTANPGPPPTNSVIGLSDGQKFLHDAYAAIVRFGTNGMLDARNGAMYSALTPIMYKNTDYHFRLVIDIPGKKYSAYVTFENMPEVTIGTDLAFRDSAGAVNMMNYWGVEAIAGENTRVCNFAVTP